MAKGVKGDKDALFSDFPLPCIAHVVANGSLLHYVVIHKITKKQVIIADPAKGIVKISPSDFFGEVETNTIRSWARAYSEELAKNKKIPFRSKIEPEGIFFSVYSMDSTSPNLSRFLKNQKL